MKTLFLGLSLTLALLASPAWAQSVSSPPGKPGSAAYNQWLGQSLSKLQRLADEDALRKLAYSYGRGNDAISIHHADRAQGIRLGTQEYSQAFTRDTRVEVYALGGANPISTTVGVTAWAEFVDKYYAGNGYSSTVHLMSNFSIDMTGPDVARVSAYAIAPHFLVNAKARSAASADTTAEWMHCRYAYEARRQPDGGWRMVELKIYLEEIWRAGGYYPSGQAKGL